MSRQAADAALAAGDLATCSTQLIEAIRSDPGNAELRSFLFQLSAITGDWSRATKQLDVLFELKPDTGDFTSDYKTAIAAEKVRNAVWAGQLAPPIFGEPRPWMASLVQALQHDARGEHEAAHALRGQALEDAPAEPGHANGSPFPWCADADTRLGPVFELILNGEYHWMAMADVARLELSPPKKLHDLVWAIAILTLTNGGTFPVMMPVRYPGAAESGDAELMLARKTTFRALHADHAAGEGQRLFALGEVDLPLLEMTSLQFDAAMAALPEEDPDANVD